MELDAKTSGDDCSTLSRLNTRSDAYETSVVQPLVFELNALCKTTTLQFALSVGQTVVTRLYAGDPGHFRSRKRKHDVALRRVATHRDLAMSPSMLYDCLAIYELCERLRVRSWKHVSTSHLRLVLPLAPGDQDRLLQVAETQRWPVTRLEDEITALARERPTGRARGGRKRQSRFRKAIRALERHLDVARAVIEHSDDSSEPSPESARQAISVLRQATELLPLVENRTLDCRRKTPRS